MAAKRRPASAPASVPKAKAAKSAARAPGAAKPAARARAQAKAQAAARAGEPASAEDPVDAQVARIQRVIDVMRAAGAVEVELDDGAHKLRVRLKEDARLAVPAAPYPAAVGAAADGGGQPLEAGADASSAEARSSGGEVFTSPMVGTFYRQPSPDAEPFVRVGDRVGPDSVLCIIEAMKVMNEIKAETEGEVVEILAQSGDAVDYGQPLFVIRT